MNVLLYGIGGVFNFGCEAIIRGTVSKLRIIYQYNNLRIRYASLQSEYDYNKLRDLNIEIVPRRIYKTLITKLLKKLLTLFQLRNRYFCFEDISILKGIDIVYSIGGDIYTLNHCKKFNEIVIYFGDYCITHGIPYVIYGASIGPFTESNRIEKIMARHLKSCAGIYCRENEALQYLNTLGIKRNVTLYHDPAFDAGTLTRSKSEIDYIGINLSPLSIKYSYSSAEFNIVAGKQAEIIRAIIDSTNCNILLIPHVLSMTNTMDNDLIYLKGIYDRIDESVKSKVVLIEKDLGYLGTKQKLHCCRVVIAARMHCALNAITENIPTLFLSYSRKSVGMSRYVYGSDIFLIKLNEFLDKDTLLKRIDYLLKNNELISRQLTSRNKEILAEEIHIF